MLLGCDSSLDRSIRWDCRWLIIHIDKTHADTQHSFLVLLWLLNMPYTLALLSIQSVVCLSAWCPASWLTLYLIICVFLHARFAWMSVCVSSHLDWVIRRERGQSGMRCSDVGTHTPLSLRVSSAFDVILSGYPEARVKALAMGCFAVTEQKQFRHC